MKVSNVLWSKFYFHWQKFALLEMTFRETECIFDYGCKRCNWDVLFLHVLENNYPSSIGRHFIFAPFSNFFFRTIFFDTTELLEYQWWLCVPVERNLFSQQNERILYWSRGKILSDTKGFHSLTILFIDCSNCFTVYINQ